MKRSGSVELLPAKLARFNHFSTTRLPKRRLSSAGIIQHPQKIPKTEHLNVLVLDQQVPAPERQALLKCLQELIQSERESYLPLI
jgi:hypothetical protein